MFANDDNEKTIKTYASLLRDIREADENGKMPSKAQVMKMCKDGKTKKEICDMYPDCDQEKLKDMVDSCMNEMAKY
tara:strand:- start:2112 stop:2339 length:228 start_codon:yes stop_codon:yes gene_type:complete